MVSSFHSKILIGTFILSNTLLLSAKTDAQTTSKSNPMSISYRTDRGAVMYQINPQNEDIYLTISTQAPPVANDSTLMADSLNNKTAVSPVIDTTGSTSFSYNKEPLTGKVLEELRKAQEAFYKADYPASLEHVNKSLSLQKSAEGYALRGTIMYMADDHAKAKASWKEALKYNPDMPGVIDMLSRISTTQGVQ